MKVVRKKEPEEIVDEFVSEAFSNYATENHVDLNYEERGWI